MFALVIDSIADVPPDASVTCEHAESALGHVQATDHDADCFDISIASPSSDQDRCALPGRLGGLAKSPDPGTAAERTGKVQTREQNTRLENRGSGGSKNSLCNS